MGVCRCRVGGLRVRIALDAPDPEVRAAGEESGGPVMTDPNRHIQAVPETLVEFLNARLDEETEAWAGGAGLVTQLNFAKLSGYMLRDIEAKRAILAEHERHEQRVSEALALELSPAHADQRRQATWAVLRHLASVYSEHPNFDPRWKS